MKSNCFLNKTDVYFFKFFISIKIKEVKMSVVSTQRAPTPIIHHSCENIKYISQNSLAIVKTCYCFKVVSEGHIHLEGRISPSNDEIKFFYNGKKYKFFASGKGIFYLGRDPKGELTIVRDKQVTECPRCDSFMNPILNMP
jgi:hypothetical protein